MDYRTWNWIRSTRSSLHHLYIDGLMHNPGGSLTQERKIILLISKLVRLSHFFANERPLNGPISGHKA